MIEDLATTGERLLRDRERRVTRQRKAILQVLALADGHLDAHEIYERARREQMRLSLSTVYRTLGVLKEGGLVRELHLEGEQHHYELDAKDDHSHLICLECGRVIELDRSSFADAAIAVGLMHGFEIESAQVELVGRCADCRQRERNQPGSE
jgi:Fe2+ or Zn2+ uptake regulation protein